MQRHWLSPFLLALAACAPAAAQTPLRMSVYATAGDVTHSLSTPEGRGQVAAALKNLNITGIFLEGRRGDSYVSPAQMKPVHDFFRAQGFRVAGGIATVPGKEFGTRQNGPYGWLNYQSAKTQRQLAEFFRETQASSTRSSLTISTAPKTLRPNPTRRAARAPGASTVEICWSACCLPWSSSRRARCVRT